MWEFAGALPNTPFSVITRAPKTSSCHIHFKTELKCALLGLFSKMLVSKIKRAAHSQVRARGGWMRTQRSLSHGLHYALHSESVQWIWMILRGSNKSIKVLTNGWDHFPPLGLGQVIPGGARTLLPRFGKRNRWPGEGVRKHSMDQWPLKQELTQGTCWLKAGSTVMTEASSVLALLNLRLMGKTGIATMRCKKYWNRGKNWVVKSPSERHLPPSQGSRRETLGERLSNLRPE